MVDQGNDGRSSIGQRCANAVAAVLTESARISKRVLPARTVKHEEVQARNAERFRRVTENSLDLICETTIDGRYSYASPNYAAILGYEPEELIGLSVFEFCHPDERAALLTEFMRAFVSLGEGRATFRYQAKSGEWRWFEGVGRAFLSSEGPRAIVIKRDITARKAVEERLRHLEEAASLDARTGIPNRTSTVEHLATAIRSADERRASLAVLVCSLDHFNIARDNAGRAFGDALLRAAAVRIASLLQSQDTLGIIDDSRFAIVAPSVLDAPDAASLALRLLEAVRRPFAVRGTDVAATASIGIAFHPVDGNNPGELLDAAELAMNRARHAGRDRFMWATAPDGHGRFRHVREAELQHAIAVDEFELHFQPIVDAQSEELVAFEALARWKHPVHGLLLPDAFIPLAERSGLVVDLGMLVLRRACAQLRAWRAMGFAVPRIAINVSAQQVWRDDLVDRIGATLAEYELSGADVEIELTETTAMGDVEAIKPFFRQLRSLGVQIAIDDFGTGYSSLAYLRAFPIQRLKIDRSFVTGAESDEERTTIIRTIASLARGLGLGVVAEGVENEAQAVITRDAGCRELQGFYYSPPLVPHAAEAYLRMPHAGLSHVPAISNVRCDVLDDAKRVMMP